MENPFWVAGFGRITEGLAPSRNFEGFPNFLETMVQRNVLSYELFTFDLPNLGFYFGVDEKLEPIIQLLSDGKSHENQLKMDRHIQKVFDNFLILPMTSSHSYEFRIDRILLNGRFLEESLDQNIFIDSGNTLLAFPMSFYADFKRVFNLSNKCRFQVEDNAKFKQLICSKNVLDEPFEIEFVLPFSSEQILKRITRRFDEISF